MAYVWSKSYISIHFISKYYCKYSSNNSLILPNMQPMFIFPQLPQYFYLKFGCANQDPSKAHTLQLNDADLSTPSRVCTPFLFPIADWSIGETRPPVLWVSHSCALLAGSPLNILLWLLARSRADSSVTFWQAYFMGWCLVSIRRRMCEPPLRVIVSIHNSSGLQNGDFLMLPFLLCSGEDMAAVTLRYLYMGP